MYRLPGSKWTPTEERDAAEMPFEEFAALHPHRTYNSWRIRRGRLAAGVVTLDKDDVTLTVKPEATEDEWEELFASLEKADGARGMLAPTQEMTEFTSPDDKPIGICFLGDIHAGASGVRYDQLREDLELIRDTEGLYVCGTGDYTDNFKHQARSGAGLYQSLFASPNEQIAYVATRLAIARGKWLCLAAGNHDQWDGKWAGIDRMPALASHLGTAYFSERGGTVLATVGATRYVIVVKHDFAGRSRINKSNAQRRAWDEWPEWANADVVCLAHLHEPDLHVTMRKGQSVTYLRNGTFKVIDPWAESNGYKPSYGVPVVVLDPGERKVTPFGLLRDGVRFLAQERN